MNIKNIKLISSESIIGWKPCKVLRLTVDKLPEQVGTPQTKLTPDGGVLSLHGTTEPKLFAFGCEYDGHHFDSRASVMNYAFRKQFVEIELVCNGQWFPKLYAAEKSFVLEMLAGIGSKYYKIQYMGTAKPDREWCIVDAVD